MSNSKLTPKQAAFAQHYALHGSATAAYRAAGYASRSAKPETIHRRAIEVLQNGKVAARIEQLKQRIQERAEHIFDITADRILQELAAIGFANMEDFVTIDANGQPELDLGALQRHQWAAVGEFTIDESGAGERASKRTRFKLLDKKGALVELGKYAGVLTEKHSHEHSHKHEVISTIAREFDAGLDQFFARTLADDGGGKTTNRTRRAH